MAFVVDIHGVSIDGHHHLGRWVVGVELTTKETRAAVSLLTRGATLHPEQHSDCRAIFGADDEIVHSVDPMYSVDPTPTYLGNVLGLSNRLSNGFT